MGFGRITDDPDLAVAALSSPLSGDGDGVGVDEHARVGRPPPTGPMTCFIVGRRCT